MVHVKIEVPDGFVLACNLLRAPRQGEYYLSNNGNAIPYEGVYNGHSYIILKKKEPEWLWPSNIKCKWIVCNEDHQWVLSDEEPMLHSSNGGHYWKYPPDCRTLLLGTKEACEMIGLIPPPLTDWKSSKRRNPNYGV